MKGHNPEIDEYYMKRALQLARKGEGRVSPNPMVGAVIVKSGRIIGEGFHEKFGGNHAEINAILKASDSLRGSTFYITLEPCTHFGKTPPCTDRIIEARPARAVIGTRDPNPLVAGKGISSLKKHGIQTDVGILAEDCSVLNEKFFHFMQTYRPFVTLKFAQTVDGRIATAAGNSRWISSETSLRLAHKERSLHDAVLVGIGTVLSDDPELTVRRVRGKNPTRIILDASLRIPLQAKIFESRKTATTVVATALRGDSKKKERLAGMGIETITIEADRNGHLSLPKLLQVLGEKGISSLLVEGGASVITSFLRQGLAQRLLAVIAPKIIGRGVEAVGDLGIKEVDRAIRLDLRKVSRLGDDVVIDAMFI
jgi:diaminohydroxyphosphoribosylaminopyrimidine deaminase/5-amino-6-(5-phosphoribosylamino)uracil reductase